MKRKWAGLALAAGILLSRAIAASPAMAGWPTTPDRIAAPVDSPAFARRQAPSGQLGYLQAIRFIDDGMKYVDPLSAFFISSTGEMCFFVLPNFPIVIYDDPYRYWCLYPQEVGRVEALPSGGDGVNIVRLWCRYDYPQCAHRLFYPVVPGKRGWAADNVVVPTIAYRSQQAAIEDLVYIMGGYVAGPPVPVSLPLP